MSTGNRPKKARRQRKRQRGAHRYQRGAIWWAYLGAGERISLHTKNEAEAELEFRRELARCDTARREARAEKQLADIARGYLDAPHGWTPRTKSSATSRAIAFVSAMEGLGVRMASQITTERLDRWRTARMKVVSRATINRDEDTADKMLRWGATQDPPLCDMTPMKGRDRLREPERPTRVILPSPEEVQRVAARLESLPRTRPRATMPDPGRGVMLFVIASQGTGLRLDELRHLPQADVFRDAVEVAPDEGPADTAWTGKNFRLRRIPVAPEVADAVRAFVSWRTSSRSRLSESFVNRSLEWACTQVGVPRFTAHDLRRVFATECVRAGVPLTTVQDWMGHADLRTTQRYLGQYRSDAELRPPAPSSVTILGRPAATVTSIHPNRT